MRELENWWSGYFACSSRANDSSCGPIWLDPKNGGRCTLRVRPHCKGIQSLERMLAVLATDAPTTCTFPRGQLCSRCPLGRWGALPQLHFRSEPILLVRAGGTSSPIPKVVRQGFDCFVIWIGVGWCSRSGRHFDFLCCRLSGHDNSFPLFVEEPDQNRGGITPPGEAVLLFGVLSL